MQPSFKLKSLAFILIGKYILYVLIYKNDDKHISKQQLLPPISLLCITSKVLEQLANLQDHNPQLSPYQYGVFPYHSCFQQLRTYYYSVIHIL